MAKNEQPILQTVMTLEDVKEAYDEAHLPKGKIKRKADEGKLEIITKRVVVPTAEEIAQNPSSRSAKLRVARFIE